MTKAQKIKKDDAAKEEEVDAQIAISGAHNKQVFFFSSLLRETTHTQKSVEKRFGKTGEKFKKVE